MIRGAAAMIIALENAQRPPLAGVSVVAWSRFEHALTIDDDDGPNNGRPRPFNARAHSGGLGCFGLLPLRLIDLDIVQSVRVLDGKTVAVVFTKDARSFFSDPLIQRDAFNESMRRYDDELGKMILPAEMSRSGALALHHRLGPHAFTKWQRHKQPSTLALFKRANGLF